MEQPKNRVFFSIKLKTRTNYQWSDFFTNKRKAKQKDSQIEEEKKSETIIWDFVEDYKYFDQHFYFLYNTCFKRLRII